MDSFVAAAVASGLTLGDAVNAFCSMKRSAIARAPHTSEVPDSIVTIETSKITVAPEEGSKMTKFASNLLPSAAVSRVSTIAALVTPF